MVYELLPADYEKVRPLFQPQAEYLTFCAAVLEGIQPGRVFVDDLTHPGTALMITRDVWGYLAGDPHNDVFNRALNKALFTREIVTVTPTPGERGWRPYANLKSRQGFADGAMSVARQPSTGAPISRSALPCSGLMERSWTAQSKRFTTTSGI
jgi:hypothetical protein